MFWYLDAPDVLLRVQVVCFSCKPYDVHIFNDPKPRNLSTIEQKTTFSTQVKNKNARSKRNSRGGLIEVRQNSEEKQAWLSGE